MIHNNENKLNVGACILFHEKVNQTIDCIESLVASGINIYVLNNGSSDVARERLGNYCCQYKQVHIIDSENNLGVGVGRNRLIDVASEDWLLFLDNDIEMKTSGWIEKFRQYRQKYQDVEVFIPKLFLIPEGRYAQYESLDFIEKKIVGKKVDAGEINIFPGGASLIHRKLFDRLGLYDKEMFVGFEDYEFAIRALVKGVPVKGKLIEGVEMVHKHLEQKDEVDQKAVLERYSHRHLQDSYNRIVQKYGLYIEGDFKSWATRQVARMIGKDCLNVLFLVFTLSDVGGVNRSLFLLAKGLSEAGYNVTAAYYTGADGPFVERLNQEGIDVVNLGNGQSSLRRWDRIKVVQKLRNLIQIKKIDLIHAHHCDADFFEVLASIPKRIKRIVTIHGPSYLRWINSHPKRYKYLIFPFVDHFVCVSKEITEVFLNQFHFLKNKTSVIHNAPSQDMFLTSSNGTKERIRDEFGVLDNTHFIGMVGNITRVKGIECLLKAATKIKNDSFKIVIVGRCFDESYQKKYEDFIEQHNLSQKVIFSGFRHDVDSILEAIDLFVMPSIEETDPWALTEAMAKGKPIIASNVGGIPEKIIDGENGLLVPVNDSEQLSLAIDYMMANPDQRVTMGKNAQRYLKENFSYAKMIQKHESIYQL